MKETLSNANFPRDSEGRVYHLGIRHGEVSNRILTVGDHARAKAIARWLDTEEEAGAPVFINHSHRGFLTITGRYKGVPVTIMAMYVSILLLLGKFLCISLLTISSCIWT